MELGAKIALVVSLVALARRYVPSIDGWKVLVAGAVATALVVAAEYFAPHFPMGTQALAVLLGALGGTAFISQKLTAHADAVGEAVGRASLVPQDATTTPVVLTAPLPPPGPPGAA